MGFIRPDAAILVALVGIAAAARLLRVAATHTKSPFRAPPAYELTKYGIEGRTRPRLDTSRQSDTGQGYEDVSDACIKLHNKYRTERLAVSVPPMQLDTVAQKIVLEIVKKRSSTQCANQGHTTEAAQAELGENIFLTNTVTCEAGVKGWFDEINQLTTELLHCLRRSYPGANWHEIASKKMIGHFTQVMWETSTGVACARTTNCPNWNQLFCLYRPPGNYRGVAPFSEAVWNSLVRRQEIDGSPLVPGAGLYARASLTALTLTCSFVLLVTMA
ncbi:scp family extracellular subfamily protein [Cystoisospora suis]|uniref:Scp family extracellular subfamily protein n=1 Tax=Cystoisospora suis TaxID=483139 RepID=A0A2C6LB27_9APIC|nr:scp family extracellular subfamily protein [Cystoisospora suis]